jgi:tRNA threonylcarbamoyl adenosine modification protein YjeE
MRDLNSSWSKVLPFEGLGEIAAFLAKVLLDFTKESGGPFCLWLQGGLGAGKTTLTGYLLRALGLPPNIPVTSPTYTYMNEYCISSGENAGWYAHLDLYRASSNLDVSELGVFDARPFRGFIVEWPEMLSDPESLAPTHVLRIELAEGGARRSYELFTSNGS